MTARSTDEIRADLLIVRHSSDEGHRDDTAYRLWHDIEPLIESRERAIRWAVTLESQNAEALALHESVYWGDPTHLHCGTCVNDDGEALAWPCPTVAALTGDPS